MILYSLHKSDSDRGGKNVSHRILLEGRQAGKTLRRQEPRVNFVSVERFLSCAPNCIIILLLVHAVHFNEVHLWSSNVNKGSTD